MAEQLQEMQEKDVETRQDIDRTKARKVYTPAVDVMGKKDEVLVIADMPGVDEKSIDITIEKNVLTLYGRVEAKIPEGHRLIASGYGMGDYRRVFSVSEEIDRDKISAKFNDGVLRLVLPKAEAAKAKKIAVSIQ